MKMTGKNLKISPEIVGSTLTLAPDVPIPFILKVRKCEG